MTQILEKLILPQGIFFLCFITGLIFILLKKDSKIALMLWAFSMSLTLVLSVPFIGESLVYSLEKHYPPNETKSLAFRDITILAGGGLNVPRRNGARAELGVSGDRIAYAANLYLSGKTGIILITAGNLYKRDQLIPSEAQYTRQLLMLWGVSDEHIIVEPKGTTTYKNAVYTNRFLTDTSDKSLYLVSSAYHLPRLMATFCNFGIHAAPLGANRLTYRKPTLFDKNPTPTVGGLMLSTIAIREYAGIIFYRLRGYISANSIWHPTSCDAMEN